ncbi:MAG: CDP-alcohol phosphatidyltransferase family protein [Alphaproteobacteria bacterium]
MIPFKRHYIPNALTVFRLLAAPVLVYLFLEDRVWAACLVFTLAAFSDLFDGFLARALDAESDVGALLDPLADKILVLIGYITLAAWQVLPGELVLLVVLRDLAIVTVYFSFPSAKFDTRVVASPLSKLNTAFQASLLFIAYWVLGLPQLGIEFDLQPLLTILIWIVVATTVSSGFDYLVRWRRKLKSNKRISE